MNELLMPLAVVALLMAMGRAHGDEVDAGEVNDIPAQEVRAWPPFQPFDEEVLSFMRARNIPGAALAVSRNGRLVLAKGYGWAEKETRTPVVPDSLFRIASVSKPITAVAVLKLVEQGVGGVTLETPVFDVLGYEPHLSGEARPDPRLACITVRHLLQHTAGWDRGVRFDPMFRPVVIAREMDVPPPAGPGAIIPYMLGFPLDHDPGSTYAYSNFGYCILGRLIEKLSGRTYERFVQEEILAPLQIHRMQIGHTLAQLRAPGEVCYYDREVGENVMTPEEGDQVSAPYGTFYLEAMDAHGGWIASAPDLVRFACAFDDPTHCPLLRPETVATMFARPEGAAGFEPDGTPKAAYYGCGWLVRPTADGKANHWHNGSLPGTYTLLVRRHDGLNWAILFNQRSDPSGLSYDEIDPALHRAADNVKEWPVDNLWDLKKP